MNMSRVISRLIMQQALFRVALPFKKSPENIVMEVLKNVTIPEFSQFEPWIKDATVNLATERLVDKKQNIYLLPDILTTTPVITVVDVKLPYESNRGLYGDICTPFSVARTMQGVLTMDAYSMAIGAARSEPTFEYLNFNKLRLYGFPKSWVTIQVTSEHDPNGETIPDTCYDSFIQLATLDLKVFLYNNLKLWDGMQTAFGQINLKIDEMQSAEADRNTLLDDWRNTFHLDMPYSWTFM